MIPYLNRVDCCTKLENLELVSVHSHVQGTWFYQCRKCGHADYYPVDQVIMARVGMEEHTNDGVGVKV